MSLQMRTSAGASTRRDFGSRSTADFRTNFEQNAPFVRRVVRRMGVSHADTDDLLQEIFFVVHRKGKEYDGRSPFRSWLYGICLRTVSTYRRSAPVRQQAWHEYDVLDDVETHLAVNPEENVELRRACRQLEGLLVRLDDDKRTVFVLFEIEGLSMTEIAETVGCPLQTAYSRLHAARKAMRALVLRHRLMSELHVAFLPPPLGKREKRSRK